MLKFPKPLFADLLRSYRTEPDSVHACAVLDPTQGAVSTCACRMGEALVLADDLVTDRPAISKLGNGKGDGTRLLLGAYGYGTTANTGRLCPHGISRGAQDLGAFLKTHWSRPTLSWPTQATHDAAPVDAQGRTGVVCFLTIPGFSGQGHIDLWNQDRCVGHGYWASKAIWFWQLD